MLFRSHPLDRGGRIRGDFGDEDVFAVVAEFVDGLLDVVEGAVAALFGGALRFHGWVPAAHQFLHAGYVDGAVVEVVLNVGQVGVKEAAVGADADTSVCGGCCWYWLTRLNRCSR